MKEEEKVMLTVREFANLSGFGERFVRQLSRIEGFPVIRAGKKIFIHREQALAWLVAYASGGKAVRQLG